MCTCRTVAIVKDFICDKMRCNIHIASLHYNSNLQLKNTKLSVRFFRQKRDQQDLEIILNYLKERNPFNLNEGPTLRNIFDGMESGSSVNVDRSFEIGEKIVSSMRNQCVSDYTFKKVNQAITMQSRNSVMIDGEAVTIDPQLLFQRLILLVGNMDDSQLKDVFKYELSHRPPSIFDEKGYMRSGENTSLDNALLKEVGGEGGVEINDVGCRKILSGEYLLNKVAWKKNQTYDDILNDYVTHVQQYNSPTIVFDAYTSGPSIEDEFHLRKCNGVTGVKIAFTKSMPFNSKKDSFLINKSNKQRFTDMLCDKLIQNGCNIIRANNNLNVEIAKTVMKCSGEAETTHTIAISDDSDLLYVLCSQFKPEFQNVFFKFDGKGVRMQQMWDISKIQTALGEEMLIHLPFVHAIAGCKTTSHLFGVGKGSALKKLLKSEEFQRVARTFNEPHSSIDEILESGKKAIVSLYNGKYGETLNELRYSRFANKVSTAKSYIDVQSLPPTESAAHYHLLRVYLQTQIWLGNESVDVAQYGWKNINGKLMPKTTDLAVAPNELLSSIKCGCKGDCATKRCMCKKNGMPCSIACGTCKGIACLNASIREENDEDEDIYDCDFD